MLRLTRSGGNCTAGLLPPTNQSKVPGLAFFLALFPRGWAGEPTTGSFVNNWDSHHAPGHAGWLTLNKTADDECGFMAHQGCMGPSKPPSVLEPVVARAHDR